MFIARDAELAAMHCLVSTPVLPRLLMTEEKDEEDKHNSCSSSIPTTRRDSLVCFSSSHTLLRYPSNESISTPCDK